jgi:phospholipase/carboxylesterase
MMQPADSKNQRQSQRLALAGEPLERARAAMIMLHGRGATAQDILTLTTSLDGSGFAYLAPQAVGNAWYPNNFRAPLADNEPFLSSALSMITSLLDQLAQVGISAEHTILLGFSQGACLTLEYAARHARRYGGIVGLSGGLIGPDDTPRNYPGSLVGTPVFLGCSDIDPYIPKAQVEEAAAVMKQSGGNVTTRLYPHMDHTVNLDELHAVQNMIDALI